MAGRWALSSHKLTGLPGAGRGAPPPPAAPWGSEGPGEAEGRISLIAGEIGGQDGGPSINPSCRHTL